MNKTKKVLFVCTGNTCRSSMAEALFKKMLKNNGLVDIQVSSAGTSVFCPSNASEQAIRVMNKKGIDLMQHQSQQVTQELIEQADLILTMTRSHQQVLLRCCPKAADKLFTLKEYAYDAHSVNDADISDPFGLPEEYYSLCADEIYRALEKVLEKLKNEEVQ